MVTQQTVLPARFRAAAAKDGDEVEIHRDDAGTVALFFLLATQWLRHPFTGHRTGLDYSKIQPTAELADITVTPGTFLGLRAMEDETLLTEAKAAR